MKKEELIYEFMKPNEVFIHSLKLAEKIVASGIKPNYLVGVWRGGAPVSLYVQGVLEKHGIFVDHIPVRSSLYKSPNQRKDTVGVHGIEYITDRLKKDHTVLIVDDVFESGLTMDAIITNIINGSKDVTPENIKIAALYYKPHKNKTNITPDHYLHEVSGDEWIVFPHEIADMPDEQYAEELAETEKLTPKRKHDFFG